MTDPDPAAKSSVYVPSVRPDDSENWLLDLLLQGYEYKADKASLALQEVGLPQEFLPLAQEHARFFLSESEQAPKDLTEQQRSGAGDPAQDDGRPRG